VGKAFSCLLNSQEDSNNPDTREYPFVFLGSHLLYGTSKEFSLGWDVCDYNKYL
jgi:hypothetical protein